MTRASVLSLATVLLLSSVSAAGVGRYRVLRSEEGAGRIDVIAERASLFAVTRSMQIHVRKPIVVDLERDRMLNLVLLSLDPLVALQRISEHAGLVLTEEQQRYVLRDAGEPVLTIDVKEEEVRVILTSIQEQCGIRNLMVDPKVQGRGTFLFHEVPCSVGIRKIFQSIGLRGTIEPNSILRVTPR
ncbi:MAG TPA: hypothetical protein VMT00_15885 [Thermoanaerobaculia bacterium]|nr:hypothetical protein [Thermoanaerobaculia bacterium]